MSMHHANGRAEVIYIDAMSQVVRTGTNRFDEGNVLQMQEARISSQRLPTRREHTGTGEAMGPQRIFAQKFKQ